MWVFLSSESLLFAGLFALYAAYRFAYPAEFHAASAHANLLIGTINTYILLTSSLTMALAIHATRQGNRRRTVALLCATIAFGLAFYVLKLVEYAGHLREGLAPGNPALIKTLILKSLSCLIPCIIGIASSGVPSAARPSNTRRMSAPMFVITACLPSRNPR